ncbi:Methionine aminopeptidase 1 [Geodia barretti]|uniref:Methionine aminopeptidase n=1 Tax=Geodia barretti TaxID=519541 RepID=A0AA35XMK3_GEOBA|nr:Methionine aminopeptidase 1 [Geodia barretti]
MAVAQVENICSTISCGKPATLQCPTCLKLGIKGSFFCAQECFKSSWKVHKVVHQRTSAGSANSTYNPWPGFEFTGPLRPAPLTPKRAVPDHIVRPDYAEEGIPHGEKEAKRASVITQLSPEEIEGLKVACRLGREVLDVGARAVRPGVTTDEIDRLVHEACMERDCYPSPLNYYHFPKSCCTSVNEVICHGIPDTRELQDGDICNIDVTVYYSGFHGDLNETMFVGKVDEASRQLVQTAYDCMMKAIEIVRPGVKYRDVGNMIQKHAQANGCSVVRSYCGHGINQLFHTVPNVPHYSKNKAIGVMKPGHSFTIEPMINHGTWKDVTWPDDWTSTTADGKRSAQFEHTMVVTDSGCDVLTARRDHDGLPHFLTPSS